MTGWGGVDDLAAINWRDVQPDFETSHFLNGFNWPDGKYRFRADWPRAPFGGVLSGPWRDMPSFPDYWPVIEDVDADHPFRLATSPARSFLNSTFNETPSSRAREGKPCLMIHPGDAAALGIADDDRIVIGNTRGEIRLHAKFFDGVQRGVVISEGIWPNDAFEDGKGINTLTGADAPAPVGGGAFHDNKVWVKRA